MYHSESSQTYSKISRLHFLSLEGKTLLESKKNYVCNLKIRSRITNGLRPTTTGNFIFGL